MEKINYELTLNDFLYYQEYLVKSKNNPSIEDSIIRYKRLIYSCFFVILPIFYIGMMFINPNLFTKSFALILFISGSVFCFILNKGENTRKLWWKTYKKKSEKDLLHIIFDDGKKDSVLRSFELDDENIIISKEGAATKYSIFSIDKLDNLDDYIIILFKDHNGTIIPKHNLTKEQIEVFNTLEIG